MAVIDDDVYARVGSHCVPVQAASSKHLPVDSTPDRVVGRRRRQDLDSVYDVVNAFDPRDASLGFLARARADGLTVQDNVISFYLKGEVVVHAVVRKLHQLLTNALGETIVVDITLPRCRDGNHR